VEGGKRNPSISVLGRIVTALGVDIEELFRRPRTVRRATQQQKSPKINFREILGLFDFRLWQQYPPKPDLPPSALSTHLCHSVINFVALDIAVQALTIMAKTTARKRLLPRERVVP